MLDPFAGGGAIPLEAMRLGCEVTAMDINPVAWFILKCTLEYPQKLAGQTRPLPEFALRDGEFVEAFLKAKGFKGASLRTMLERLGHGQSETQLEFLGHEDPIFEADLAWQVRAWGRWVLARARKQLAPYYPTYAECVPLAPGGEEDGPPPMQLLEVDAEGIPQLGTLNSDFDESYLRDPRNPRWVAKPPVAYLWARTVKCKQCRAMLPLLKTRWRCKKERKRVLLTMEPNADGTGVVFGVDTNVPRVGGNAAQRREHDRRIGAGTMSRTGATCPCCGVIMTKEDIRLEGRAGRLGAVMTTVVVSGVKGKEYRLPTKHECNVAEVKEEKLQELYADIPFGLPEEPTPKAGSGAARAFSVDGYGFDTWRKLFTNRQLLAIGALIRSIRSAGTFRAPQDGSDMATATTVMLAACLNRATAYLSTICIWEPAASEVKHTFTRFALPITWDFGEGNPLATVDRFFAGGVTNVSRTLDSLGSAVTQDSDSPSVLCQSALVPVEAQDVVVTDPPLLRCDTIL